MMTITAKTMRAYKNKGLYDRAYIARRAEHIFAVAMTKGKLPTSDLYNPDQRIWKAANGFSQDDLKGLADACAAVFGKECRTTLV